jgi:hypothetical protein
MAAVIEPVVNYQYFAAARKFVTRTGGPDVIVLQHNHAGEIIPMSIDSSHYHSIFFDESET